MTQVKDSGLWNITFIIERGRKTEHGSLIESFKITSFRRTHKLHDEGSGSMRAGPAPAGPNALVVLAI